jgi:hypothetical protein
MEFWGICVFLLVALLCFRFGEGLVDEFDGGV